MTSCISVAGWVLIFDALLVFASIAFYLFAESAGAGLARAAVAIASGIAIVAAILLLSLRDLDGDRRDVDN